MSDRSIGFDEIIISYLNARIKKDNYDSKTIERISIQVLGYFNHVQNPTGYYISKVKESLNNYGNVSNLNINVSFESFLYSSGHLNTQYYKNKTKYNKTKVSKLMLSFYEGIDKLATQKEKLAAHVYKNINNEIVDIYYPPTPKIQFKIK